MFGGHILQEKTVEEKIGSKAFLCGKGRCFISTSTVSHFISSCQPQTARGEQLFCKDGFIKTKSQTRLKE